MLKKLGILLLISMQGLGFHSQALAFSAQGEKIRIHSCVKAVCYTLSTHSILTSQFGPVWNLTKGTLDVWPRADIRPSVKTEAHESGKPPKTSAHYQFVSGKWDQLGALYTLRTEKAEVVFDTATGQIQSEPSL